MLDYQPILKRIRFLLDKDTDQSITYAALEARLALEKVCYDRLRQNHDYISHDQLRRWQPGSVINTLLSEVDPHATSTRTLKMAPYPAEETDFVEIGAEVGFDPKQITKMWNALGRLALHVRMPEHSEDDIPEYGDRLSIRSKVEEVVRELERLSIGTMTISGIGEEVWFDCSCGEKNRRRAHLLQDGQHVHCTNPDCKVIWKAAKTDSGFNFESLTIPVNCEKCGALDRLPWYYLLNMRREDLVSFACHQCGHKNHMQWQLFQVALAANTDFEGEAPDTSAI